MKKKAITKTNMISFRITKNEFKKLMFVSKSENKSVSQVLREYISGL